MTSDGSAIIIEGKCEDWPGGDQTLTPSKPHGEHNRQTYWFGAELHPDGNEVWFRITLEGIERMNEKTPRDRGDRLITALLHWMKSNRPSDLPDFDVEVNDDGYTCIRPRDD